MCSKCDGFVERFNIRSLWEYRDTVRQLIEIVNQGRFVVVRADCGLEEVFGSPLPGDTVFHHFECTTCQRVFQLFADTYHGNASWTVKDD